MPMTALQADSFDEFDQEMSTYDNPDSEQQATEYATFVSEYLAEFDQWRSEYVLKFDINQQKVAKKWGSAEVSEKQKNVEYASNSTLKSVIDYENNEVIIEVLVDESLTEEEATKVLLNKVAEATKKESSNLNGIEINKEKLKTQKLVITPIKYTDKDEQKAKDIIQLQTQAYLQDVEKEADKFILENDVVPFEVVALVIEKKKKAIKKEETVRLAKVEKEYKKLRRSPTASIAVTKLKVIKYKAKLPKNGLAKRAKLYIPFAEKESDRFDIPVALVMAIMHSESAFDYKAKSAVPAYGLMQIVPRTAGHDVNKLVRSIDAPMKVKDLYVPSVNVETGTAYLNILDKRYLKAIKDPQSRLYCMIAAYNTGAGNVAKVFNKKGQGNTRNINRAAKVINTLSPQEVYDMLIRKLPYDETKHYLKKVNKRIKLYQVKA
jgi:membrane-bound lytic murein transglycosylase C